jgi:hypothetical protein
VTDLVSGLPFRVVFPKKMNDRERRRWIPVIRLVHLVCNQQNIGLEELNFHHHVPPQKSWGLHHEFGEADLDDKIISLCSKDFDTALHELAHIWTDTGHTEKWAKAYRKLILIYLLPEEAERRVAIARGAYPAFKKFEDRQTIRGNKVPPLGKIRTKQG